MPALTGPFVLAAVAYGAAALVLVVLLRPDPLLVARERCGRRRRARRYQGRGDEPVVSPAASALAATAMVLTQLVMVAVMTMTPVHLRDHGHGSGWWRLVIRLHVAFMFLPSPLSGWLADRLVDGRCWRPRVSRCWRGGAGGHRHPSRSYCSRSHSACSASDGTSG